MFGHETLKKVEENIRTETPEAPVIHAWQDCRSWPQGDEEVQLHPQNAEQVLYEYPEYYLG